MLVEKIQYRGFNPELDSRPVMHSQYLRPEEDVLFVFGTPATSAAYDVRGRQRDGKPKRSAVLSALKSMLLGSARLIVRLFEIFLSHDPFPEGGRGVVPVTVAGSQPDCRAAMLADAARGKTGVWILTDQRCAFVEVRNHDQREAVAESTREHLELLQRRLNRPGEWSDRDDRPLGPVTTVPVFELTADEYEDQGRHVLKPKGSKEGVFHLLKFPDSSSIALGIDSP